MLLESLTIPLTNPLLVDDNRGLIKLFYMICFQGNSQPLDTEFCACTVLNHYLRGKLPTPGSRTFLGPRLMNFWVFKVVWTLFLQHKGTPTIEGHTALPPWRNAWKYLATSSYTIYKYSIKSVTSSFLNNRNYFLLVPTLVALVSPMKHREIPTIHYPSNKK